MDPDSSYVVYYGRDGKPVAYSRGQVRNQTAILVVGYAAIAIGSYAIWPIDAMPFVTALLLGFVFLVGHAARVQRGRRQATEFKASHQMESKPE